MNHCCPWFAERSNRTPDARTAMPPIDPTPGQLTARGELVRLDIKTASGWGIGELRTEDGRSVRFVGTLTGARVGQWIEISGSVQSHERYGDQLRVRGWVTAQPDTAAGTVAWLCSTLPDIGESRARELVKRFGQGAALWDVLESRHTDLAQIRGITPARADAIRAAYLANRAERDHMIRLRDWGLTDRQVTTCRQHWSGTASATSLAELVTGVRAHPYQLARRVPGFGFKRSDAIALAVGIAADSPARIAAGLEHVLGEQRDQGHCYTWIGPLARLVRKLLGVDVPRIEPMIAELIRDERVVRRGERLYLTAIDRAESTCADVLRALGASDHHQD